MTGAPRMDRVQLNGADIEYAGGLKPFRGPCGHVTWEHDEGSDSAACGQTRCRPILRF